MPHQYPMGLHDCVEAHHFDSEKWRTSAAQYPFTGYINSPESVDRGYITKEEIHTMMNTEMFDTTHELVRDLFLFSVFTGLAYSDVKNLTTDNFQTFFDGNLWIITRRKNINTKSNIRLLDVPRKIIEKHKGMTRNGHVSPVSSNPPAIRYWKKSANNVVSRHD